MPNRESAPLRVIQKEDGAVGGPRSPNQPRVTALSEAPVGVVGRSTLSANFNWVAQWRIIRHIMAAFQGLFEVGGHRIAR